MLRLRTLGGLSIEGYPLSDGAAGQRRLLALLALLAVAGPRGLSRDKIVALLWPDSDSERARNSLSQALSSLRRQFGAEDIVLGTVDLHLNPQVITSDVAEYESHVAAGRLDAAANTFDGPFLDGVYVRNAPEFERWVDRERQRLERSLGDVLERLAAAATHRPDFSAAIAWCRKRAELDATDSRAALALMQAYVTSGDRTAALEHYRSYERVLREHLDLDPDPTLKQFVAEVRSALTFAPGAPNATASLAASDYGQQKPVAKDPHSRFASARKFAEALDTALVTATRTGSAKDGGVRQVLVGRRRLTALGAVAIAVLAVAIRLTTESRSAAPAIESLVVLPLNNLNRDSTQAYFVAGMHEALIAHLAQVSGRRAISRTSAMHYAATSKSIPQIATELGVDAVVEGSVLRAGDSVRIQLQLIAAHPERHLWTETYQRSLRDVLSLHSEIAGTVARQIAATISDTAEATSGGTGVPHRPPVVNPEAYDQYLRGQYYLAQAPPTLNSAIRHFERAVELDSTSARAHAGLAVSYWLFRNIRPEYLSRARVEARVATDLDPTLADAHVAVGLTRMDDWDWQGSEAAFRQAIALNPSSSLARQWYTQLLRITLRLDEGLREVRRAIELDPFSLFLRTMEGWVFFNQRRQDDALEVYRKVLELEPGYGLAMFNQGLSYWAQRRGDKVIDAASRSMQARLRMTEPHATYLLTVGYALAGRPNEARATLDSLEARHGDAFPYTMRAAVHHALGDDATALTLLERALALREPELPNVTSEPQLDGLRQHPRFRALRAQMRLP